MNKKQILVIWLPLLTLVISILLSIEARATRSDSLNNKISANSVNLNLLGNGSLVSLNYERLFHLNSRLHLSTEIGVGYNEYSSLCITGTGCKSPNPVYYTLPHSVSILLGKGSHFLEMGAGGTLIPLNSYKQYIFYPEIGYRIQPIKSSRINFKCFIQIPKIGTSDEARMLFFLSGISFGFHF